MADKTVKMERDGRIFDIHPSNVEDCLKTGWVKVEAPKKPARKTKVKPKE